MEQGRIYSMLDIAIQVLKESNEPLHLTDIFQKVSDIKGFDINSVSKINQLYQDMTQSALFVYVGDGCWDLKERNLEAWDKDGTDFEKESNFDSDFLSDDDTEDDILEYENYTVDTEHLTDIEDFDDNDYDYDDEDDLEEKSTKGVIHTFDEEDEIEEDEEFISKLPKHEKEEDDFDYDDYLDYDDEDEEDDDDDINKYNDIMDDYESEY